MRSRRRATLGATSDPASRSSCAWSSCCSAAVSASGSLTASASRSSSPRCGGWCFPCRRGSGRRGFRPRALSLDLPPCAWAALGQPEGRTDARDVRTQPRLVHGDPARPQGPHEHVFRTRGPRTVLRPPHRRVRLQYAVGVQGAGRPRKGHRPPCICR